MDNKIKYGLVGLLIGGVAVWGLMSTFASPSINGIMGLSVNSSAQNSDVLDAHFIEQMVPHHEDAITMAKLAQTKAKRTEVKQLAQNIIDSQSVEINQMKDWYKNWFGKDLPTGEEVMDMHGMMSNKSGMHMGIRGDESDISRLENAEDFDVAFVEHMIPHHQMAVMMASMLKNGTKRSEMKKLADDIISAQTKEIDQMRSWLQDWR